VLVYHAALPVLREAARVRLSVAPKPPADGAAEKDQSPPVP
jgi:hypothetical protein